ncbi:nucleotidyltransferase family protein [Candidatus Uabimicrobium amorphum]|uniref:MobA-like NTP transferase domain-containing protein n=1 Tax=Uabimicrobium amorphum TaxID=2596890 RepID=A0A5S9IRW7_UABAM|nr:NTP transferase domain-containing protein [Candidatus Uabimicrobium amorphum]BBM85555.1 hypothetical protein UABAM_03925 [Candidatus Uabimicrobium amorphum]
MVQANTTACIVLTAGLSTRMGKCKSTLMWDKNQTFLQKIYAEYTSFGCSQIITVVNKNFHKQHFSTGQIVVNPSPEKERFYSLKLGLQKVQQPFCFLQPIDQPFIEQNLLQKLCASMGNSDYIVPCFEKRGGHPILFGQKVIDRIANSPQDDENLREVLRAFTRKNLQVDCDHVLRNIDTPREYGRYFSWG